MNGCKGLHCPGCRPGSGGSGSGGAGLGVLVLLAIVVAVAAYGRPILRAATDLAEVVAFTALGLVGLIVVGGTVAGVVIARGRRRRARAVTSATQIGHIGRSVPGRAVAALPAPRDDLAARSRDRVTTRVVASKVTALPRERSE